MYNLTDYQLQLLHEDRLREAARLRAQNELIRDASEPMTDEMQSSLLQRIKQVMRVENRQPVQENRDVRPAHA